MDLSKNKALNEMIFGEPQAVINDRFQNAFIELNAMVGALVVLCLNRGVFSIDEFNKLRVRTTAGIDQAIAKQQEVAQKDLIEKLENDPVAKLFMDMYSSTFDNTSNDGEEELSKGNNG